jgi:hypothetical protein
MIEIEDIKYGDLIILSTGEESVTTGVASYNPDNKRYKLEYKSPVKGWLDEARAYSWWYNRNGTFVKNTYEAHKQCADIVKVVHNGSIQTED